MNISFVLICEFFWFFYSHGALLVVVVITTVRRLLFNSVKVFESHETFRVSTWNFFS